MTQRIIYSSPDSPTFSISTTEGNPSTNPNLIPPKPLIISNQIYFSTFWTNYNYLVDGEPYNGTNPIIDGPQAVFFRPDTQEFGGIFFSPGLNFADLEGPIKTKDYQKWLPSLTESYFCELWVCFTAYSVPTSTSVVNINHNDLYGPDSGPLFYKSPPFKVLVIIAFEQSGYYVTQNTLVPIRIKNNYDATTSSYLPYTLTITDPLNTVVNQVIVSNNEYYNFTPTMVGVYKLNAIETDYPLACNGTLNVGPSTITVTLQPSSPIAGDTVNATWSATLSATPIVKLDGTTLAISTNPEGGHFVASRIVVPGEHSFTVTDSTGVEGVSTFTVAPNVITISTDPSTIIANEPCNINWSGTLGASNILIIDGTETAVNGFTYPYTFSEASHVVSVRDGLSGVTSSITVSTSKNVIDLTVTPSSPAAGEPATISWSNTFGSVRVSVDTVVVVQSTDALSYAYTFYKNCTVEVYQLDGESSKTINVVVIPNEIVVTLDPSNLIVGIPFSIGWEGNIGPVDVSVDGVVLEAEAVEPVTHTFNTRGAHVVTVADTSTSGTTSVNVEVGVEISGLIVTANQNQVSRPVTITWTGTGSDTVTVEIRNSNGILFRQTATTMTLTTEIPAPTDVIV